MTRDEKEALLKDVEKTWENEGIVPEIVEFDVDVKIGVSVKLKVDVSKFNQAFLDEYAHYFYGKTDNLYEHLKDLGRSLALEHIEENQKNLEGYYDGMVLEIKEKPRCR
jgi:hypothetical protein